MRVLSPHDFLQLFSLYVSHFWNVGFHLSSPSPNFHFTRFSCENINILRHSYSSLNRCPYRQNHNSSNQCTGSIYQEITVHISEILQTIPCSYAESQRLRNRAYLLYPKLTFKRLFMIYQYFLSVVGVEFGSPCRLRFLSFYIESE